MVTKPRSLLLQKKADMLPVPGEGGVGGIDVADRDSLARHTLDDPASPANNYNPFYGKGTELDSLKNANVSGTPAGNAEERAERTEAKSTT